MNSTDFAGFLAPQKYYVVFGISLSKTKIGNIVLKHLQKSGYSAAGINPKATGGNGVYGSLKELPRKPDAAIIAVSPGNALGVVAECASAGIKELWMQPGTVNQEVSRAIDNSQLSALMGRCLLLYLRSAAFPHNLHRGILNIFGRL